MNLFIEIRRWFFQGDKNLTAYENSILRRLLEQCEKEDAAVLSKQLAEYSYVQRTIESRFVVFFFHGGKPSVLLKNRREDYPYASLRSNDSKGAIHCVIYTQKGRLHSLMFERDPKGGHWEEPALSIPAEEGLRDYAAEVDREEHGAPER